MEIANSHHISSVEGMESDCKMEKQLIKHWRAKGLNLGCVAGPSW